MNTYKIKFTQLQQEIFRFLCIHAGESFNQRTIARRLDMSPPAVANVLPALEKEGLVQIDKSKTMNLVMLRFNRDSQKAVDRKRTENLSVIFESGLADFLEEHFAGCAIVLFGSYALGEDTVRSDVDIAIIGAREKQTDMSHFEKFLERPINLQFFESISKIGKNLRTNVLRGITLRGIVEI